MQNKIPYIIVASTIGLLSLILIQVKWMQQSKNLIEAQFDQKVSMALCQAVESMSGYCGRPDVLTICGKPQDIEFADDNLAVGETVDLNHIRTAVSDALIRYKIELPFELDVRKEGLSLLPTNVDGNRIYSCSLDPLAELESEELSIRFPDKQAYVLGQMGLMLVLSVIILLFITGVFIYANYYLLRQKQLRERNQEFFNHMAHEFKTPLTNIGLAAKMLRKKSGDNLLDIITTESQQLDTQVNRVLSMASLEAGRYDMQLEKVAVGDWIRKLIAAMDIQLKHNGATVELREPDTALWIEADRFHLANAVRNILENAVKYCETKASIIIEIQAIQNKIRIGIQDNGIGISPDKQQLIFEKFYRIQSDNLQPTKGFGLGLSYVKKIVELHGGSLEIASMQTQGTNFALILPQAPVHVQA